jgi:hypothetical protein
MIPAMRLRWDNVKLRLKASSVAYKNWNNNGMIFLPFWS